MSFLISNFRPLLYILLAANNKGIQWLNHFLSQHLLEAKPFPLTSTDNPFFNGLWDGFVIYPLHAKNPEDLFANERIGILPVEVNKLYGLDMKVLEGKLVIRQPVTFQGKIAFNVHRLLRAIDKNVLLSKLPKETECSPDEYFLPPDKILNAFRQ